MLPLVLLQVTSSPDACFLTGFCGIGVEKPAVAAGVYFVALGLILTGVMGLWHTRRRSST